MAASPRIRRDLKVETAQDEAGVLYYDVSDPHTGGSLRLFDFEWLIAERIDGRSFEELARWAQGELGLETTAEELLVYAQRLGQLGIVDLMAAELPLPEAAAPAAPALPPAAAALAAQLPRVGSRPPIEAAPTLVSPPPAAVTPLPVRPVAPLEAAETLVTAPPPPEPALVSPPRIEDIPTLVGAPPPEVAAPLDRGPAEVALTVDSAIEEAAPTQPALPAQPPSPAGPAGRPVSDREPSRPALPVHSAAALGDDVMGQPLIPAATGPVELVPPPAPPEAQPETPPEAQPETQIEAQPEAQLEAPPEAPAEAQPEVPPEAPAEAQPERKATLLMPTVVAPPEPAEPPRAASALSERPTAPIAPIGAAPEAPAEAGVEAQPEVPAVERVTLPPTGAAPVRPAEQERPPSAEALALAPLSGAPLPIAAAEAAAPAPASETGSLPIDASGEMSPPEESAAPAATTRPVTITTEEEEEEAEGGAGAGRWIALLILVIALGLCAYLLFGLRRPPAAQVQVKRAQPHEVSRTLGAQAVVQKSSPQVLRMEGGGVLASVVTEGAEVSAGMSLAVLQSHAKLQKEIGDLKERLAYYQRRREVATEKGDETAAKEAQAKVTEKEERLASAEVAIKKAQILATRSGKVSRVLVHAGDLVSPGSEIVEISDRHLSAEVTLPQAEAQGLKAGEDVQLEGGAGAITGRIAGLTPKGAEVLVQIELPDESSAKPGDALRLLRGRLSDVEVLPGPAVVSGDTVYVVSQGKAERRKVTIVDHRGSEVLVTGLRGGEEVVVQNAGDLHEGQLVRPVYGAP